MGLELRRKPDGKLKSQYFYGSFQSRGRRRCVNLGIKVDGTLPKSLFDTGDAKFERSRARAQQRLEDLVREAHNEKAAEKHLTTLYEIKSGQVRKDIELTSMGATWKKHCSAGRSADYVKQMVSLCDRFSNFVRSSYTGRTTMSDVTRQIAQAYIDDIVRRSRSAKTVSDVVVSLRSVFRRLAIRAGLGVNPFDSIELTKAKASDVIHRQPFNHEELEAVLKAADDFTRPLFIAGACTAMRLGDCCQLRWSSIDMKKGFVRVKTSKTGETVDIPIFPKLLDLLQQLEQKSEFCFPEQAALYSKSKQAVSKCVKRVLGAAGVTSRLQRQNRARAASVRDFHSLRTTWITLALVAGVPMEIVRRVTGHTTADTVLKHYFRPGREQLRQALEPAMPQLLATGAVSRDDQIRKIVMEMTARSRKRDCERILALLGPARVGE